MRKCMSLIRGDMKQGTNAKGFPPKPWTIVQREVQWSPKGGRITHYVVRNLITNEEKPPRLSYSSAWKDIPKEGPYAEPWGV